uniref:Uncharacterized protein n=1 Tax=Romanomermis culicivorax TaxID=13658 RepID=A0A915JH89_ROMCU
MLCRRKTKITYLLKNATVPFWQNVIKFSTPRGNYAILTDGDVQSFEKLLGSSILKADDQNPSALDAFNIDWTKQHEGIISEIFQERGVSCRLCNANCEPFLLQFVLRIRNKG